MAHLVRKLFFIAFASTLFVAYAASESSSPDAARFSALEEKAQRLEESGKSKAAAGIWKKSQIYAPDDRVRAEAVLHEADAYFAAQSYVRAQTAYELLLTSYPLYTPYAHVLERLRTVAAKYEDGSIGVFRFKDKLSAIDIYELIIREIPTGKSSLHDYLKLAKMQEEVKRPAEAILTYQQVIRKYSGSPEVAQARLKLAELLIANSVQGDGDGRRSRQARRQLGLYVSSFPNQESRQEAEVLLAKLNEQQASQLYDLAVFYTRESHRRLPAARRYLHDILRQYPDTAAAGKAQQMIATVFCDDDGTELGIAGTEARLDLADSPDLAAKIVKMLDKPTEPAPLGSPKKYGKLGERENLKKWLIPLEDLNTNIEEKEGK